jgi:anti-sigma regulatory factor (Ser/Thr protein kinase)
MADCVLKFPATFAAYARASSELRRALADGGIADKPRYNAELVFEEIVSNIIRHGCSSHVQCAIEVSVGFHDDALVLSFNDNGQPFDPREYEPAMPATLDEAGRGGLGLLLVRNAAAHIDYERTRQNKNRITVRIAA